MKPFIISFILSLFLSFPVFANLPPTKDLEQLDFANGLFQRDLYDMASGEYQKLIQSFPESIYLHEAYFGSAESAFFLKSYKKSILFYSQYLEKFSEGEKKPMVLLRLGQALFLIGESNEALLNFLDVPTGSLTEEFQQILYFYTAKSYRAKGEIKLSLEYFEKSLSIRADNQQAIHAFLEMAEILEEQKKYKEALSYYAQVYAHSKPAVIKSFTLYKQGTMQFSLKDYTSASETFKKVITQYPKENIYTNALSNLFLALFNLSKYDSVIENFQIYQESIEETAHFFEVFYITASAFFQKTEYEQTLSLLEKTLHFNNLKSDDYQRGLIKKIETLIKIKSFALAVEIINKYFVSINKNQDYISFLKAEGLYGMKQFEKAYESYKNIVLHFPESSFVVSALYGAAHAQNAAGKSQEAMQLFSEYFQKGNDAAKRMEAIYNALLMAKQLGLTEKAVEYSQIYISDFPENNNQEKVFFWLGTFYADLKEHTKAINAFQRFIKKYPASSYLQEVYFLLAYNLQSIDSLNEALKYYEKIDVTGKENDLFYSSLKNTAFIYWQKHEKEKAAVIIDKIITQFGPKDLDIKTVLWLAQKYLVSEKFKDVLRVLEKVIPQKEDFENIEIVAYLKAKAFQEILSIPQAIDEYTIVLNTDGNNVYDSLSRIGKGLCLMKIKEWKQASEEFNAALLEYPDDNTTSMRSRFELANIEKISGNLEDAAKLYMLVGVLYSDDEYVPKALFQAGKAFKTLGRVDTAQKIFKELLTDYPKSDEAKKLKKQLKNNEI